MLELGDDFAFLGRQKRFVVEGKEYFIDLLFCHLGVRRYVVVELKVEEFEPEFAGKAAFYAQLVDTQRRRPEKGDEPTVALLLCAGFNRTVVEYSLGTISGLVGVADYSYRKLPRDIAKALPSPKQLEESSRQRGLRSMRHLAPKRGRGLVAQPDPRGLWGPEHAGGTARPPRWFNIPAATTRHELPDSCGCQAPPETNIGIDF